MQRESADEGEDEPLELTPDMEADESPPEDEDGEIPEDEDGETPEEGEGEGDEDEGPASPGFGDDETAEGDSSVIRTLRERNRQLAREIAEARAAIPAAPPLELPVEPTLADCDYDEDKYKAELLGWDNQKRKIEDARAEQTRQAEDANRDWQRDMDIFTTRRAALALPDFEDSATAVQAHLSLAQQAVIVKAASDSAAFVYALGRSDARLAELAKIQDPIKLAAAIARMEGGIKVVKKRKAPAPDRAASGSSRMPGGADKHLEKLEKEADESGNRTELIAYRKKLAKRDKK